MKKTYSLTEEQMSRVEARLDEAEEASSRISRKDWILLFSGSIFTLIIAGTVTPDIAQHVMMMAFHGLGHLFYRWDNIYFRTREINRNQHRAPIVDGRFRLGKERQDQDPPQSLRLRHTIGVWTYETSLRMALVRLCASFAILLFFSQA